MCYLQNPVMEAHGGPGTLEFFRYVADRTDIALGMFNSPSSGYVMSAAEIARIAEEIPAMCAIKDAAERGGNGMVLAKMAPGKLVYWDVFVGTASYLAGYVQLGFQAPCVLGGMAYLTETPSDKRYTNRVQPRPRRQARGSPRVLLQCKRRWARFPRPLLHAASRATGLLDPLRFHVQVLRAARRSPRRRLPALPSATAEADR